MSKAHQRKMTRNVKFNTRFFCHNYANNKLTSIQVLIQQCTVALGQQERRTSSTKTGMSQAVQGSRTLLHRPCAPLSFTGAFIACVLSSYSYGDATYRGKYRPFSRSARWAFGYKRWLWRGESTTNQPPPAPSLEMSAQRNSNQVVRGLYLGK